MKKLYLVEQVYSGLKELIDKEKTEVSLLLLTPEAVAEFKDSSFDIIYPEDLISSEQLNEMGLANFDLVRSFIKAIDDQLQNKFSHLKESGLKLAYYHFDKFKMMVDSVTSRILILSAAIERAKPDLLCYQKPNQDPLSNKIIFKKYTVYSLLSPIVSKKYELSEEVYNFYDDKINIVGSGQKLKKRVKYLAWYMRKIVNIRTILSKKENRLLSFNTGYDQKYIIKDFKLLNKFEILVWKDFDLPIISINSLRGSFNLSKDIKGVNCGWQDSDLKELLNQLRLFCLYEDIDWFSLVANGIRSFLVDMVPLDYQFYLGIKDMFKQLGPDIVMTNSGVAETKSGVFFKAAKDVNISRVMVQHGGGGYGLINSPSLLIRDFDQVPDSHYFLWGKGVSNYFKEPGEDNGVKLYPLGSPVIRNIFRQRRNGLSKNKSRVKTIFYVIQNFREAINSIYYPGGAGHYTDTWYFRLHLEMIDIFKKHSNHNIVIKAPSNFAEDNIYQDLIKDQAHISFIKNRPLVSMIDKADIFIVDSMSTSILQCAATDKPIIVYAGRNCKIPVPEALASLEKRAICAKTRKDYLDRVDSILTNPDKCKVDTIDDQFIRLYGVGDCEKSIDWDEALTTIIGKD